MAARRLDMNHGFMRSIIKNQVDRNKYEKENQMRSSRLTSDMNKNKKPDKQLYQPPSRTIISTSGENDTQPGNDHGLFKLEFEDENGTVHCVLVQKGDSSVSVAAKIGKLASLPRRLIVALRERLKEEFKEEPA